MSNNFRYDHGDLEQIDLPTVAGSPLEVGDLCCVNGSGYAVPASSFATAALAAAAFAGVVMNKRGLKTSVTDPGSPITNTSGVTADEFSFLPPRVLDPGWVSVAISGCFRYPCVSGTVWTTKSFVEIALNGAASACLNQQVVVTTDPTQYIGVIRPRYTDLAQIAANTLTEVVVDIKPAYAHGGLLSGS